jgi:hypothetical protein
LYLNGNKKEHRTADTNLGVENIRCNKMADAFVAHAPTRAQVESLQPQQTLHSTSTTPNSKNATTKQLKGKGQEISWRYHRRGAE